MVAAIRAETAPANLAARLGDASPQYRYEAARRLGALKTPLPADLPGSLAKLVASDAYGEIRAAGVLTLEACDPAGAAGWQALGAALEAAWAKDEPVGRHAKVDTPQQLERRRLALAIAALGAQGEALLAKHWETATPVQRRGVIESCVMVGHRLEFLLADARKCLANPQHRANELMRRSVGGYLTFCDAAKDPATAELMLKVSDWTFHPTLMQHVTTEKLLGWIEPLALDRNVFGHVKFYSEFLDAWSAVGPAAIPSMKKVAAQVGKQAPQYAKDIEEQVTKMVKP